jgi:hypothetical protein
MVVIFVLFMIIIIVAVIAAPKKYVAHAFTTSGDIPRVNESAMFGMPPVCSTQFEGISMLQFAGIAETPYDSVFGQEPLGEKLALVLGRDWNKTYQVVNTIHGEFAVFEHLRYDERNLDFIVVRGANSISDELLAFSIATLYHLPEQIFAMIPMATLVFDHLLKILIGAFNAQTDLYTPRRLTSAYLDPVQKYIESIQTPERRIFIVGSSIGGAIAKVIGMHLGIKAIAFNSPEIRLWFIGDLSQESLDLSFAHNVLIPGQTYTGSEAGGIAEYIPFDNFPLNPATSAATICILGIQCQIYDHFQDYCEKYISRDALEKMKKLSPYR